MTARRPPFAPLTMLDALPEPGREHVLETARGRRYARGEVIVRQGDDAGALHIIESGRVAVRLLGPSGDNVILAVMGPGEVFGEMAVLVQRAERTATVQAIDEVVARSLRKDDFDQLRQRYPKTNDFLLQVLARRADRLSRMVFEAHHVPAETRLARRLLEVGRLFAGERMPVVLPLTQDEIAQLTGTTRPTANQMLKRLESDLIIHLDRGRVELLDIAALRKRA